jgi:hypothetical protein
LPNQDLQQKLNKIKARRHQKQPTPLPWSGQYESTVSQLGRDRDLNDLQLSANEQQLRSSYGFDDNSDPFSRARQLQENFANANRGTLNNYAAAGQLYAGSTTKARDIDRTNFEQAYNAERQNYEGQLSDLYFNRLQNQNDYTGGVLDAEAQRLEDALNERVDPAEAPKGKNKGKNNKKGKK